MRVLITGATGFIGRALVARLLALRHEPVAVVRSPPRARDVFGEAVSWVESQGLGEAVARADAIVNLAGEPVLPRRWTRERKRLLIESRVGITRALVAAIEAAPSKPKVLVSASAVGYYGDRAGAPIDESSAPGQGFLAELCKAWEDAALSAERSGVRVVIPRLGMVLGRGGGALAPMLRLYKLGLGGPLGSGRQQVSWIHLDDATSLLATALEDERYSGAINAVAPAPVTQRELATTLGRIVSRPARVPTPAAVLRLVWGEAASMLLGSQRAEPRRLLALGFPLRFTSLEPALAEAASPAPAAMAGRTAHAPS